MARAYKKKQKKNLHKITVSHYENIPQQTYWWSTSQLWRQKKEITRINFCLEWQKNDKLEKKRMMPS